jgi:subtilisin family serine protease
MMRTSILLLGLLALPLSGCATGSTASTDRLVIVAVADGGSAPMPSRGYHRPGYRVSVGAATTLASLERDYRLRAVDGWPITLLDVYCAVMAIDPGDDVEAILSRIGADPRVVLSQPLHTFAVHGGYNDPYFAVQYGDASNQLTRMHRHATGRGVHVAVIDTGVDRHHPDLAQRIETARNFVDGDTHFDSDIHGTAVAGIIAASADNGAGIVGVAPEADLLALKACWQTADDDISAQCSTFTLAKALTYAIEANADVINLSLGGPDDPLLALLVRIALTRGTVVVAAQSAPHEFPADVPGVIAVRAVDPHGTVAATTGNAHGVLDVAARALLSTSPGGGYDYFSGSSMAAARVAGLTALLREEHGARPLAELRRDLDQRLAVLGAHGSEAAVHLATHAPGAASIVAVETLSSQRTADRGR